jgi:hypothetical protein
MSSEPTTEYLAECFWPGVKEADLHALDDRAARCADELTRAGEPIRYLGSLLLREDEVVLCLFQGPKDTIHTAATRARIPFERILEAARTPWPKVVGRWTEGDSLPSLQREVVPGQKAESKGDLP